MNETTNVQNSDSSEDLESSSHTDSQKNSYRRRQSDIFFCDWVSELFGIDEDFIPSSEEDEGLFHELEFEEDLEERARALTPVQLDNLRQSKEVATDDELRERWKKNQIPRYGRRARVKPTLERENHVQFECICDIDRSFSRHYIPHFGGGVAKDGEELRTPHFAAFWEDYKEKTTVPDINEWNKIVEKKPEKEEEKGYVFRPMPKFKGCTKDDIKKFKQQLLSTFRPLNAREIRRYRMPFADALYLELQEDRYLESAAFFKYLILKDFYMHPGKERGGSLRHSPSLLKKLVAFLKLAERSLRRKEYHIKTYILLRSGKYFKDHDENLWWLAKEFYTKAVKISEKSVIDGGKSEAIARYILGTFLLDHISNVQLAQEHLSKARELSLGKNWNAQVILNTRQEPVYKECTTHLCRALIAASTELRKNGKPEESLPLIHHSYKLCQEPNFMRREIEMQTYFELGMTYGDLGMLDWAKIAFKKFIEIAKLLGNRKDVCDGYLELAICFRSEGDLTHCHYNLVNYLETAQEIKNENLIAFGNRYLGEYHLNNGNARTATTYFRKSFNSFLKQLEECSDIPFNDWKPEHFTLTHDLELTRLLLGLSEGETLTKTVCHLILLHGPKKNDLILKLLLWKNKKITLTGNEYSDYKTDFEEAGDVMLTGLDFSEYMENFQELEPNAVCELCGMRIEKSCQHQCPNEHEDKKTVHFEDENISED